MSATGGKPYIPFHPNPSRPSYQPPPGAVDAHCHVFGPAHAFPYAAERKYTPIDASKEDLFHLRDFLGFSRNVIVQATCHGKDNSALLDALAAAGEQARGVVTLGPDVGDGELARMHKAGVRGVRFNFVKRLVDFTPREVLAAIAARIAPLGWHVVVYFEAPDLGELEPFFASLPTPVIVDHMGRPDVKLGRQHPQWHRFTDFMATHPNVWTKVSCPERLTLAGAPYDDVVPFSREIVERFPSRVLWGTDWPHPNMTVEAPDDGILVDVIPEIAMRPEHRQMLLIENPMRLYWS